jgi:hypothetical protein
MLLIAVLNGAARDLWYKKHVGELLGHQISTVLLIICFGFYISFVVNKLSPDSGRHAIYIGLLWLLLTLIFEFGFGLIRGYSWTKLLGEYNILKGRIWILVPIWTTIAPYVFLRISR